MNWGIKMNVLGWAAAVLLLAGCATAAPAVREAPRVDYHQHMVSPAFAPIGKLPVTDGRAIVARLDASGVEKAVVLSMGYSFGDERKKLSDPDRLTAQENDWTSRQVVESRGRLIGFCGVNPLREAALTEIERCLKLPGMRGLKLHLGNSGVSLRQPAHLARMQEVFALTARRGAPILVHMRARGGENYGAPDARLFLEDLVPKARGSEIVVAHFGASGPGYPEQADEVMAVFAEAADRRDPRMRNLYFDLTTIVTPQTTPENGALLARRIRQVGADRVLFGTDTPTPESPPLKATWALIASKVPLTPAELRIIAENRTRFVR